MENKKKDAKASKKAKFEINPEIPDSEVRPLRMENKEIAETLTVVGRLKAAKKMRRLSSSGVLQRGKRKKELLSMTSKRASTLGWKAARRQMKTMMARGKDMSQLAPGERERIEKIASRKKETRKALARKLTRAYLAQSYDPVNDAFEVMLEGKRYHQLFDKNGSVKFDMRFKHFRDKVNPHFEAENDEEVINTVEEMFDVVVNESAAEPKHYLVGKGGTNLTSHTSQPHFKSHEEAKAYQKKFKHVESVRSAKVVKGVSDKHGFITPVNEAAVEVKEAAAVKAFELLYEKTGEFEMSAHRVARSFGVSAKDLIEAYENDK